MTEQEKRSLVTTTGRELLHDGLVVRTWGNISCRLDQDSFLITPSGLDYLQTKDEDLAIYHLESGEWEGPHKPSSEKGVHAVAYAIYPDAEFVIHTHQAYATSLSVHGDLDLSEEEETALGGVAIAAYGLPGTKKLKKNVQKALETGAKTILMAHHGALVVGSSKEDAYKKALLLEEVCKRNWLGKQYLGTAEKALEKAEAQRIALLKNLKETYPLVRWVETAETFTWARSGKCILAQLDDMAQMIGRKLEVVEGDDLYTLEEAIYDALEKKEAVLVKGLGAIVNGKDEDDTEALAALVDKACICKLHTHAGRVQKSLSLADCTLMRAVYVKKYSKLK